MTVVLTAGDVDTLITSLEYSARAIRDADATPYELRRENLSKVEAVAAKLRAARRNPGSGLTPGGTKPTETPARDSHEPRRARWKRTSSQS